MITFILIVLVLVLALLVVLLWPSGKKRLHTSPLLHRIAENPVLEPIATNWWESEAVFNPAAVVEDGRVHLFYRALGRDGISRIGYASSADGINFDQRLPFPVYAAENVAEAKEHHPYTSPARLTYDTVNNPSGGGWGGCEDPRAVKIDGRVYITFNLFNGWSSMRVAQTSIDTQNLTRAKWLWSKFNYLSREGERHKNWVLFPEKINGKFALFHNLYDDDTNKVKVAYMDNLSVDDAPFQHESPDPQQVPNRVVGWHHRTRSAASPPIKTKKGWILLYHAMDKDDQQRYKVGALLLDLNDPTRVLYRSHKPILSPDAWYENDWKPGIIYASGGVVFGDDLMVYYGGGDKRIAVAKVNLDEFLAQLTRPENKV
ncbi:MAG TPA: hypothetical protein VMR46_00405 [Candidatus Paceibacterota bacterium]|nr:hypothetical protein [Candidatus Paceibacterota bacterium]